jgi:peptide/nickel transport system substrate-binding protein
MSERERLHSLTLNRRRFLIGSAAAAASAVLAACGGSSTSPTATTAPAAATKPAGAATTGSSPAAANTPAVQAGGATPTFAPVSTAGSQQLQTTIKNPPPGKPQGNKPSELVLAWGTNQLTTHGIDGQLYLATIAESQLRHIYEPMVKVESDGKTVTPVLATSWKRLDDNTMQFVLRQNVMFHNGEEWTADAVKWNIERILDPKTNADGRTTYSVIDKVDVVDKYTVNIHTAKPDPVLLLRMSGFAMNMIAPKWAAAAGNMAIASGSAGYIGTGPYKLKSWSPNQDLVVEAFDGYWGPKPVIKNVRMKTIADAATRVAAVRSGDVHVAKDILPEEVDNLNKSGRQTARAVASNRIPFYFMEVRKPPLDNPKLRQAINYAANIDGIIQAVLLGNGTRVSTILAPWHVGFDPTLKPYPYDVAKAKSLMAEAGFPNGFDVNINYIQGRYMKDKEVAEAIAQELNKAGIRCKPILNDSGLQTQKDNALQLDGLIFASWGNWLFDADNSLYPLFSTDVRDTINAGKGASSRPYSNPEFDKLITEARFTLDVQKRNDLYAQAQKILYTDAPALFMYQLTDIYGVDNWVKWEPRFDEMVWAQDMKWNE